MNTHAPDIQIVHNLYVGESKDAIYADCYDVALVIGEHATTPVEDRVRHRVINPRHEPTEYTDAAQWLWRHWMEGRRCLIRGHRLMTIHTVRQVLHLMGATAADTDAVMRSVTIMKESA